MHIYSWHHDSRTSIQEAILMVEQDFLEEI